MPEKGLFGYLLPKSCPDLASMPCLAFRENRIHFSLTYFIHTLSASIVHHHPYAVSFMQRDHIVIGIIQIPYQVQGLLSP